MFTKSGECGTIIKRAVTKMKDKIYTGTRLRDDISISELVTVHYFEFSKDYKFGGEAHDFWELIYVDKGEISEISGNVELKMLAGDIAFHKPGEWHSSIADGITAAEVIVISFYCNSPSMNGLVGRVFKTGNHQRSLLSEIIKETQTAFDTPLSDLVTPKLHRKKERSFGSEQIIKIDLCRLIITLLREDISPHQPSPKRNLDEGLFGEIISYLSSSLDKKLSLEGIARHAGISKTALKQLFREKADCGAHEYFTRLKIERAKTYIREDNFNFTQIAEMLGYNSIHYFSTQFKNIVKMSPSEYANSVKALTSEAKDFGLKNI